MWPYKAAFEMPHDHPDQHYRPVHIDYPIQIGRRLALGTAPSERVQRAVRNPALNHLDGARALLYLTWELEPHAAPAWICPERVMSCAIRRGVTFDATLIG